MVYNAMKLFMEINPQLFDDCSHEYTEQQNTAAEREAIREQKWAVLGEQAKERRASMTEADNAARPQVNPLPRLEEIDPSADDNQKRLDSLRLQDAAGRKSGGHERQASTSSVKSR